MLTVLWLIVGLTEQLAIASDTHISMVINGFSYHLPRDYYNERNTGIGLQLDEAWGRHHLMWGVGTYRDSYFTQANYFGTGYNHRLWDANLRASRWYIDAGAVLLVAKSEGYTKYYHVPMLIAPLPWVAVGNERYAMNMMFAPAPNNHYASVLTVQLKIVLF
ncbi:MAG: hypothetical protein OEW08_13630 [Gammaproteobacteria bacterium]|nr:hypothetical protein [Gammaproteobacteria bacterium]